MKPVLLAATFVLAACDHPQKSAAAPPATSSPAADSPLLPILPGDTWTYDTRVEIPAGITSPGAAAVDFSHRRTRSYLGKISPAEGLPATATFEVLVPGSPPEREFVEIHPDRILLRGSMIMRPETTRPLWFDQAVPFISADMQPGDQSPKSKGQNRKQRSFKSHEFGGNSMQVRMEQSTNSKRRRPRKIIKLAEYEHFTGAKSQEMQITRLTSRSSALLSGAWLRY